jgi:hypothetical protein
MKANMTSQPQSPESGIPTEDTPAAVLGLQEQQEGHEETVTATTQDQAIEIDVRRKRSRGPGISFLDRVPD